MKNIFLALLGFFIYPLSYSQLENHIPGEIIVMLKPGADIKMTVNDLNQRHPGSQFEIVRDLTEDWNIWLLRFDNNFLPESSALRMVYGNEGITLAQLNYPVALRVTTPNDASFATQQWALNNTGQTGGTADADIDAPEAWDITTGGLTATGDTIVVAVIDGGFQGNHPDLTDNYWRNYGEIAGNGIDDDGNGYIDDVNGWNAYSNNGNIPSDNHGTHVVGIVGAKGNNSIGVSGVNWNVKIMRIAGSSSSTATVIAAYGYAAKQRKLYNESNGSKGAFVVATNSSFGVDFGQAANFPIWCAFYDTLGTLGILNAGGGPNTNTNIDTQGDIPTTCPSQYLIAVTNTNNNDIRNNSSGYGSINMDIGAPGTSIYSTTTGSNYTYLTGTSMATPHVAGAIGLYYSAVSANFMNYYRHNLGQGALLMRQALLLGVDSISSMATTTSSRGRLNLWKGIQQVIAADSLIPPFPEVFFTRSEENICAGGQITFADSSTHSPISWAWQFPGGTPSSSTDSSVIVTYNTSGVYDVLLKVTNAAGVDSITINHAITVYPNPAAPVISQNGNTLESNYTYGNQWMDINGAISGATSQTYMPVSGHDYSVMHTDTNGCVSSESASFYFEFTPPEASAGISEQTICQGDSVVFSDNSTNSPTFWYWEFPGGTPGTSNQQNPTVTYHSDGVYDVFFKTGNADGEDSLAFQAAITVNSTPATPVITQNGNTLESSYAYGNQWMDINGAISGATSQTYMPVSGHDYSVIHTDTNGCVSSESAVFYFEFTPPEASVGISEQTICRGDSVVFSDNSTNSPTFWYWEFPGGTPGTSNQQNPTVAYHSDGVYDIFFKTGNADGEDSLAFQAAITVNPTPATPVITQNGNTLESSYTYGNQWYNSAGIIAGETSSLYVPIEGGVYSVVHTDNNDCVSPKSDEYVFSGMLLHESFLGEINIFPNPVTDRLTVSWENDLQIEGVFVYDAAGRLIHHSSSFMQHTLVIDTEHWAKGTYILELRTPINTITKLLVK